MTEQNNQDPLTDFVNRAKQVKEQPPVPVPREYLWAGGAAGLAIIVTAWPVLILGLVLGALFMGKFGCPIDRRDPND